VTNLKLKENSGPPKEIAKKIYVRDMAAGRNLMPKKFVETLQQA